MGEKKYEAMMDNGRMHLEFAAELYEIQSNAGRYDLHEHPASASSWKEPVIQTLIGNHGGILTVAHLCQYGMKSRNAIRESLVKQKLQHSLPKLYAFQNGCVRHVLVGIAMCN